MSDGQDATERTPKKRRRAPRNWKALFVTALAETGVVKAACEAVPVRRATVYTERDQDDAFRQAWDDAITTSVDALELEARRRALLTSDTLLIFLLKGGRPEKYRERQDVQHSGHDGGPLTFTIQIGEAAVDDARP